MKKNNFLGVCSWLSSKFDLDVGGIRILFIISTLFTFGSPVLIYFVLFLIKPKEL